MSTLTKLITPKMLAEIWEVGDTSIYDLLRRKVRPLPGYKIGNSWRIDPEEAVEWLQDEQSRRVA